MNDNTTATGQAVPTCHRCGRVRCICGDPVQPIANAKKHPLYETWRAMRKRCYLETHVAYHRYGGRGIRVCPRWNESFAAFVQDVGPKPSPLHTIDRIDNDGDYTPDNVSWRTAKEQQANKAAQLRATCVRGHERNDENVHVGARGWRNCRRCNADRMREKRAAKKAGITLPDLRRRENRELATDTPRRTR